MQSVSADHDTYTFSHSVTVNGCIIMKGGAAAATLQCLNDGCVGGVQEKTVLCLIEATVEQEGKKTERKSLTFNM